MRSFWQGVWLVSLAVAIAGSIAQAQVPTTTVTDTVYRADGTPAGGTVLIRWPAFTTAGGSAVAAGSTSVAIGTGGSLTVALAPNAGSTPMGTYYTAVFHLDDGTTSEEFWVVPVAVPGGAPVTVGAIRNSVLPSSVAMQTVSKQYVDAAIAAAQTGFPEETSPYVRKTGDTMTGPLVLPALSAGTIGSTGDMTLGSATSAPAKAVFYQGPNGTAGQQSFVFADYNQFIVDSGTNAGAGNLPLVLAKQTTEGSALTIQENGGAFTATKWWYDGPTATGTGAWLASAIDYNIRLGDSAGTYRLRVRNAAGTTVASVDSTGKATLAGIASGTASNTDLVGTLPLTSGATTTASYTFAGAYATAPVCLVQPQSATPTTVAALGAWSAQVSTTTLSVSTSASAGSSVTFGYVCAARN